MGGFVKGVFRIAAPVVGAALGGPAGAALGGALGQTVTGGNRNEILMGGVTGGLGAYAGNSAGSWLGKTLGETSAYSRVLGTGITYRGRWFHRIRIKYVFDGAEEAGYV